MLRVADVFTEGKCEGKIISKVFDVGLFDLCSFCPDLRLVFSFGQKLKVRFCCLFLAESFLVAGFSARQTGALCVQSG